VRKSLGATSAQVARLLISDFSKPVVIGNLVALPFAYYAGQSYIAVFAERINLTPMPFLVAFGVTLAIAPFCKA
jgi:putative ABC transport system permease protein